MLPASQPSAKHLNILHSLVCGSTGLSGLPYHTLEDNLDLPRSLDCRSPALYCSLKCLYPTQPLHLTLSRSSHPQLLQHQTPSCSKSFGFQAEIWLEPQLSCSPSLYPCHESSTTAALPFIGILSPNSQSHLQSTIQMGLNKASTEAHAGRLSNTMHTHFLGD